MRGSIRMMGWGQRMNAHWQRWRSLWRPERRIIEGILEDDNTGDTIEDGHLVLVNQKTGKVFSTETGAGGAFEFPLPYPPDGDYDLYVYSAGYEALTVTDIPIVSDLSTFDHTLDPSTPEFNWMVFDEELNGALGTTVYGDVDNDPAGSVGDPKTIDFLVPSGTVITALVPSWSAIPKCGITQNGVARTSGVSNFDFTTPLTFLVIRDNDPTNFIHYTVTVTVAP